MSRARLLLPAALILLTVAGPAPTQPRSKPRDPARPAPKLEPVAETRLLMEGLAAANFRGLDRHLRDRPADAETWAFVRGQAKFESLEGLLEQIAQDVKRCRELISADAG